MTPADPASIPGELYAGPYGFLVAIAFFLFLAARELRRYRQIDNTTYREEIAALKADVLELTREVGLLRDEKFAEAKASASKQEQLIRENAALRALAAEHSLTLPESLHVTGALSADPV